MGMTRDSQEARGVVTTIPIAAAPTLSCDGCTLCCKLLGIDELKKPAGQWCSFCSVGVGCDVQDKPYRPPSCGDFECVWLQTQKRRHGEESMPPELRPDRCRVVMGVNNAGTGLVLYVEESRPDAWRSGAVGRVVRGAIQRGERVIVVCGSSRKIIAGKTLQSGKT